MSASAANGDKENADSEDDVGPGARRPDFGLSFPVSARPRGRHSVSES